MKGMSVIFLLMLVILGFTVSSCQGKVEKAPEVPTSEVAPEEQLAEVSEPIFSEVKEITAQPSAGPTVAVTKTEPSEEPDQDKKIQLDGKVGPKAQAELGKYLVQQQQSD